MTVALIVAILVIGAAAGIATRPVDRGPLQPSSMTTVEFSLAPEQAGTWGVDLLDNPTASDIVVRSIELIDPEGLSILGMTMINTSVVGGIINALRFPPPSFATFPVEGSVISPRGGPSPHLQVLVGVQLAEGRESGSIKGLRLRYVTDGREYEVDLPYGLGITLRSS